MNKPYHYGTYYLGIMFALFFIYEIYGIPKDQDFTNKNMFWLLISFWNFTTSYVQSILDNQKSIMERL